MLPIIGLLVALVVVLNVPSPAAADEAAPSPAEDARRSAPELDPPTTSVKQIEQWISQLGDDAYRTRQAAAEQLLAAGMSAREPLLAVVDGPDPEIRAAARRLVALIDRGEFDRRLEAFAADTDGRRGLTLPGWDRYRELVGGDAAARALFVDMQRQEGPLLAAVFGASRQPAEQIWEDRLLRLVSWQATVGDRTATPPLGSCAAMLLLGAASEVDVSDRGAMLLENLIQRPPMRENLAAAESDDALRRLVVAWVLHCPNENEVILARRLNLVSTIDLQEALPLALAVAGGEPQYTGVAPAIRAVAVLLVGQFGDREHVQHLEPLLEDKTVCMPVQAQVPGRPASHVQVRDVALVVMLHLTGQRPADYGYVHARVQPQRMFQLQTLHRENDQQRAAAIAKWRAWRAAEKGREPRVESQEPEE